MTTYNLLGTVQGSESVYAYTRRRWEELRNNFKAGKSPGVTNDASGAYAASRLIFTEMKKNPGIVTDAIPDNAGYLESIIKNPSNPFAWVAQKTVQATNSAAHSVAVNLDKPAQWATDVGNALPWYTKPGAIVGLLAATVLLPPVLGAVMKGYRQGGQGKPPRKKSATADLFSRLKARAKTWK